MFGEVDYDPRRAYAAVGLEEQLEALGGAVAAGKVARVGLSNETAWGLMTACRLGAPRFHARSAVRVLGLTACPGAGLI